MSFAEIRDRGLSFQEFVSGSTQQVAFWNGNYRLARVPQWAVDRARALPGHYHLVVIAEDWCGDGTRAIPVVIVLDERMEELGWWGPRPRALQEWVRLQLAEGRARQELYPDIRRWYVRDRGESTLAEVIELMSGARVG